jgi:hypothetical protein
VPAEPDLSRVVQLRLNGSLGACGERGRRHRRDRTSARTGAHTGQFPGGAVPGPVRGGRRVPTVLAIYVSDYSRYLPKDVGVRASFWWTYTGAGIGGAWMMLIGTVAVALNGGSGLAEAVRPRWARARPICRVHGPHSGPPSC